MKKNKLTKRFTSIGEFIRFVSENNLVIKEESGHGLETEISFADNSVAKIVYKNGWMSVVGTNSKERTGYPTQKPVALLERLIITCCPKDGVVMDFYAGSGTTGQAALNLGRSFMLIDNNSQAIDVMKIRFGDKAIYV